MEGSTTTHPQYAAETFTRAVRRFVAVVVKAALKARNYRAVFRTEFARSNPKVISPRSPSLVALRHRKLAEYALEK